MKAAVVRVSVASREVLGIEHHTSNAPRPIAILAAPAGGGIVAGSPSVEGGGAGGSASIEGIAASIAWRVRRLRERERAVIAVSCVRASGRDRERERAAPAGSAAREARARAAGRG